MLNIFRQYYPIRNVFFVIGEGLAIYIAVILSTWILVEDFTFTFDQLISRKALLIVCVCHVFLYYNDLYDLRVTNNFTELSIRLMQSIGFSAIVLAGIYFVFPQAIIAKGIYAVTVIIAMAIIVIWRFGYMTLLQKGWFNERIVLLGAGGMAQNIVDEIQKRIDAGYTISCVLLERKDTGEVLRKKGLRTKYLDQFSGLCRFCRFLRVSRIVVAMAERRGGFPTRELLKCRVQGINVTEGIGFYEMLTGKLIVQQLSPTWLIFSEGFRKSMLKQALKRTSDLIFAAALLIVFFPVILIVALAIKLDSKGPVFFTQERVGERQRSYHVVKFRSMVENAEKKTGPVWAGEDDPRITRVGKIIRKLRIDEVPQLWNVFRGEMSFVGPRPERRFFVDQLDEIIPYYSERFSAKPGITGWAQVSYGYGASVEDAIEKLNYDLFYIKNMTLLMDLMIVLKTIKIVLFGKGAR